MHYLSIVFSQFNNTCVNFFRVWTKNAICRKCLRKFSKIVERFVKKIAKNALFFADFSKKIKKQSLIFFAIGRKTQLIGNFEKILKRFLKKIAKNALF